MNTTRSTLLAYGLALAAGASIVLLGAFHPRTNIVDEPLKRLAPNQSGNVTYKVRNPCVLSGPGVKCPGLLPVGFPTFAPDQQDNELIKAAGALEESLSAVRQGDCDEQGNDVCPAFLPYTTHVNRSARSIDLTDLKGRYVLLGAMDFPPTADKVYRVGGERGKANKRRAYIVAHTSTGENSGKDTVIVASYTIFAIRNSSRVVPIGTGKIVFCGEKHDQSATYKSAFMTCAQDRRLHKVSDARSYSFYEVVDALACDPKLIPNPLTGGGESCVAQRTRRIDSFLRRKAGLTQLDVVKLRKEILDIFRDPLTGSYEPYWFSCANGCCNADPS